MGTESKFDAKKAAKVVELMALLVLAGTVCHALLIKLCWGWFLTPLGIHAIGFFQAAGLGLLVTTLMGNYDSAFGKKIGKQIGETGKPVSYDDVISTLEQSGLIVTTMVALAIGVAFVVHLFV